MNVIAARNGLVVRHDPERGLIFLDTGEVDGVRLDRETLFWFLHAAGPAAVFALGRDGDDRRGSPYSLSSPEPEPEPVAPVSDDPPTLPGLG